MKLRVIASGAALLTTVACGEDRGPSGPDVRAGGAAEVRYGSGEEAVLGTAGQYVVADRDPESGCVQIEDACYDIGAEKGRYCGEPDAEADVIVVGDEVVAVICYPSPEDGGPLADATRAEDGALVLPQNRNGLVVTFPEASDGEPFAGDLRIDGERATLWGNGPEDTVLDGSVTLASNNARLRGLTVTGSVDLASNGVAVALCRIEGDLVVRGNNVTVAACEVTGDVIVTGGNTTLVDLRIGGRLEAGRQTTCGGLTTLPAGDEAAQPIDCPAARRDRD